MTHTPDEAAARDNAPEAIRIAHESYERIRPTGGLFWSELDDATKTLAIVSARNALAFAASQAEPKAETGRAEAIALAEQYAAARDWNGAYHALRIALNCSEPKAVGEDVVERVARAIAQRISARHGHNDDDNGWLNEQRREEARAAIAAMLPSPDPATIERDALERTMIGGNHLATVLIGQLGAGFAERYPPEMDPQDALRTLCATDTYEIWCCWRAIMLARASINKE